MDAHEHGQHPAWVMEQRQLRERQADAADGMTATAPDRPSLRQRLFPEPMNTSSTDPWRSAPWSPPAPLSPSNWHRNWNAGHRPNLDLSPKRSRMRDAWTTPEAKSRRTRPSIRGRSARCHRPRIRWGMISRPVPGIGTAARRRCRGAGRSRRHDRPHAGRRTGCRHARARMEAHGHDRGRHPARGLRHGRRHVRVESHESATDARELEQATADCAARAQRRRKPNRSWSNISTATGSHRRKWSRPTSSPTRKPWKPLDKLAEQYSEGERIPACAATDTETANATTSKLQAIEKKQHGKSRG